MPTPAESSKQYDNAEYLQKGMMSYASSDRETVFFGPGEEGQVPVVQSDGTVTFGDVEGGGGGSSVAVAKRNLNSTIDSSGATEMGGGSTVLNTDVNTFVSSGGGIQVLSAGIYEVTVNLFWEFQATAEPRRNWLLKNGSQFDSSRNGAQFDINNELYYSHSYTAQFAANDVISVAIVSDYAGGSAGASGTLTITKLASV